MNYELPHFSANALAKVLTNFSNAISTHTRRVGVMSEHLEQVTANLSHRQEQAIAGSTEMVISEICCHFRELNQRLDSQDEKLRQIHNLGCWWEDQE